MLLSDFIAKKKGELLGNGIYDHFGNDFPLLIKFIDADQDLSVQVHPDDKLAQERHQCPGKTEMWYILQADEGASLINGFVKNTDRNEYQTYFDNGRIMDLLHSEKVQTGEVYYLPAGRVHTIGKGLMIAEIQQTSDITYRIYDFDRVDKEGNKRELHVEEALDAINFSKPKEIKSRYENLANQTNPIVSSPFFTTNKLTIDKKLDLDRNDLDCFKIYIGIGGSGKIAGERITFGEVMLAPASMKKYEIEPDSQLELLETYIEL